MQPQQSMTDRNSSSSRKWRPLCIAVIALACLLFLALRSPKQHEPNTEEVPRELLALVEGRLHKTGVAEPFSGLMTESHTDGSLKSRSRVLNGLLDGLSEGWHSNGQLQIQEHFSAGISHGSRVKFHTNGIKMSDTTVVNGILQGPFRRWHENGTLAEEIHMRDGQPDGLALSFYPSGFLKAKATLQNGSMLENVFWGDGEQKLP
jgi:antitoxin component YwqK of YwqJK toxin-antitoxin module